MQSAARRALRVLAPVIVSCAVFITSIQSVAAAEAPGSCAAATTVSPLNTWISGAIATGSDHDWYRFNQTSTASAQVTLGDLAANYKLHLYRSDCSVITGSDRSGVQFEEILRSQPAGHYFVRVAPRTTAQFSATPYVLRFRTLTSGVKILSQTSYTDSLGDLHIPGEVFNNTSQTRDFVKITATLYNSANVVLKTDFTYTWQWAVASKRRAAFDLWTEKPAGYHHYKLAVSSSATSDPIVGNLSLAAGVPYDDFGRHYVGEVTNSNGFAVDFVQVVLTQYSARGGVYNAGFTYTDPSTLSSGQTAPFDVWVDRFAGTNRYAFAVDATR